MEYEEEDFLLLSGIQHFAFCRRQWALIHIEQQWSENFMTIDGKIFHQKAHSSIASEKRNDIIVSRSMPVFSRQLGITGVCDIVEFHKNDNGISIHGYDGKFNVIPIEYKRGKPKEDDIDILQLASQAVCLEEMLCCEINIGCLFYGETRHRTKVDITVELKNKVADIFKEMHELYNKRYTPKVKANKNCKACSLVDLCLPKLLNKKLVRSYIKENVLKENIQ